VEGVAQGRMGVDGAADIFQPRAHFEREAEGTSQFRDAGADGGDTQHQVIVGARRDTHEAVFRRH